MSDNNKIFRLLERFTCHGFYTITGKDKEQSAIPRKESQNREIVKFGFLGHVRTRLKNNMINSFLRHSSEVIVIFQIWEDFVPS